MSDWRMYETSSDGNMNNNDRIKYAFIVQVFDFSVPSSILAIDTHAAHFRLVNETILE